MSIIWLVTVGEPLPSDGTHERLLRTGILAETLQAQGHKVVWWTSTFDHIRKQQRATEDTVVEISPDCHIRMMHAAGYPRNICWQRHLHHVRTAEKFGALAQKEPEPSIILCSWPTIELCRAAIDYAKPRAIPVVVDVRDLWPDLFIDLSPKYLRWLAKLSLTAVLRLTRRTLRDATAITGCTDEFVAWGSRYGGRRVGDWDRAFPMGYKRIPPPDAALVAATTYWENKGISRDDNTFTVCFFGTIGRHFEWDTVIRAARQLASGSRKIRFVLCGAGDHLERCQLQASDCPNVIFPGWVGAPEIWQLMQMSSVGLAPYNCTENFVNNLPNKPIEYFSAGLPIISCLRGVLAALLSRHECGLTYESNRADQLADVLCGLHDDSVRLKHMSRNASDLFQERFSAEKVYGDMGRFLVDLAENSLQRRGRNGLTELPIGTTEGQALSRART